MKIGLFSTTFFPQAGGAERFLHGLATHLTKKGFEVFLIVPYDYVELEDFDPDYTVLALRGLKLFPDNSLFYELILLTNLIVYKLKYNLPIIQGIALYPPGFVLSLLSYIFPRMKVVTRATGSDIQTFPEINYGKRLDKRVDSKVKKAVRRADCLVANSESIKQDMLAAGAQEEKVKIIPNGLDLERFSSPVDTDVRKKYSIPQDSKVLLSVGRAEPRKNFRVLLSAMEKVINLHDSVHLIIVGSGQESLVGMVKEKELEGYVTLAGRIPKVGVSDFNNFPPSELVDLYLSVDIFVFPSLMEGQPNVLLEAAAAGLPSIAGDVPGSRDVVKNGETGFLSNPHDPEDFSKKILSLLNDESLLKEMSENAKRESTRYNWENVVETYIDLYEQLLQKN